MGRIWGNGSKTWLVASSSSAGRWKRWCLSTSDLLLMNQELLRGAAVLWMLAERAAGGSTLHFYTGLSSLLHGTSWWCPSSSAQPHKQPAKRNPHPNTGQPSDLAAVPGSAVSMQLEAVTLSPQRNHSFVFRGRWWMDRGCFALAADCDRVPGSQQEGRAVSCSGHQLWVLCCLNQPPLPQPTYGPRHGCLANPKTVSEKQTELNITLWCGHFPFPCPGLGQSWATFGEGLEEFFLACLRLTKATAAHLQTMGNEPGVTWKDLTPKARVV